MDLHLAGEIKNPCPRMTALGYNYEYVKGLVDKTPYYTRVEEDRILYVGKLYTLQFNLSSKAMVLVMHDDNADVYGNKPTFFVTKDLMECIGEITKNLGWND